MKNKKVKGILEGFNNNMRVIMTHFTEDGEVTEPISVDMAEFIINSWNETVEKFGNAGIELESEI
ncbi:hypothetical protein GKZ28_14670 [Clostridium chromiireducens]|uniref:Uncharacterized protein n=1 Tax=Clostridium chromiireducens TaxID=225345 RepID=A0A964RNF2_9CLOT|nr:hypothetical protein [Clostridium chromiireducens]MVX64936.1 hypothetical protein [Clostridium chromiireducens]